MRYIDADKLIDKIFPIGLIDDGKYTINAKAIKMAVDSCPTADVAPKSEVKKIFEEIDLIFRNYYAKCSENKELKLLEPLCQAERFVINEMWHEVAELKKKYTEGE